MLNATTVLLLSELYNNHNKNKTLRTQLIYEHGENVKFI